MMHYGNRPENMAKFHSLPAIHLIFYIELILYNDSLPAFPSRVPERWFYGYMDVKWCRCLLWMGRVRNFTYSFLYGYTTTIFYGLNIKD